MIVHNSRRERGSTPTVGSSKQQQLRRANERAGKPQLLLHSARQSARQAVGERRRARSSPSAADNFPAARIRATPCKSAYKSRFSCTVRSSYKPNRCGMYPMRAWICAGSVAASMPSTVNSPPSAVISPAASRISVVLPAPSGPTSAVSVPSATVTEIPSSAWTISPVSRRNVFRSSRARQNRRLVDGGRHGRFSCGRCASVCFSPLVPRPSPLALQRQANRRRLAEPQIIGRVLHEHANLIDKACPQFLGFDRLGRELRLRRNETDPAVEAALWIAVDLHRRFHSRMHFPQVGLGDIRPHPFGIDDRQRKHGLDRRRHIARLENSRADNRLAGGIKLRVGQFLRRRSDCASLAWSCASFASRAALAASRSSWLTARPDGIVPQFLHAVVMLPGIGEIGAGQGDVGDGLGRFRRQTAGVEPSDKLPLSQPVSFLDQHLRNPLVVVERQIDFPQIEISEQHEFIRARRRDARATTTGRRTSRPRSAPEPQPQSASFHAVPVSCSQNRRGLSPSSAVRAAKRGLAPSLMRF